MMMMMMIKRFLIFSGDGRVLTNFLLKPYFSALKCSNTTFYLMHIELNSLLLIYITIKPQKNAQLWAMKDNTPSTKKNVTGETHDIHEEETHPKAPNAYFFQINFSEIDILLSLGF